MRTLYLIRSPADICTSYFCDPCHLTNTGKLVSTYLFISFIAKGQKYGGCEIHHQKDGWKHKIMGCLPSINWCGISSTIHSISCWKSRSSQGNTIIPSTCWSNEPRATRCKLAQTHPAEEAVSQWYVALWSAKPDQIPCKHIKLEVMDVVFWFQGLKWDLFQSSGNCYIHERSWK